MNGDLMSRLRAPEDNFTERKREGVNRHELRRTIVAFANSAPDTKPGVIFVGVSDDGRVIGVQKPDALQKTVGQICRHDCCPPVNFRTETLEVEGKSVVAVVVVPSDKRPHFSGPAYVRKGSESIEASEEMSVFLDELVRNRLGKPKEVLKWKGKLVTVVARGKELGSTRILGDARYRAVHECVVLDCTAHYVQLQDTRTDRYVSEPLENVVLTWDESKYRLMLIVQESGGR